MSKFDFKKILSTKDATKDFDKKDISSGKGMAILSYIIPPVPYFVEKDNKYVRFHARQGMDLLVIYIVWYIISNFLSNSIQVATSCGTVFGLELGNTCKITPWWVTFPIMLISLLIGLIALFGLISAIQDKAKELPLINKIKMFK